MCFCANSCFLHNNLFDFFIFAPFDTFYYVTLRKTLRASGLELLLYGANIGLVCFKSGEVGSCVNFIFCNECFAVFTACFIICLYAISAADEMLIAHCIQAVVIIIAWLCAYGTRAKNIIINAYRNSPIKNIIFSTEKARSEERRVGK